MRTRINPSTSKDAHDSIKPSKSYYYAKIIDGLSRLKVGGNFEEIAIVSGIKPDQAWKRLSELVQQGVCYNTGITRPTSSGRKAMVRQLVGLDVKASPDKIEPKKHDNLFISFKQLSLL